MSEQPKEPATAWRVLDVALDISATVAGIALIGVGVAWWAHPGLSLVAVGSVLLGLVVIARFVRRRT
jgi:hypothetical protein